MDFVDGGGERRFALAAPWMRDAAGRVSRLVEYRLERDAGGLVVRVVADDGWLEDPARRFPVQVDPTTYIGRDTVCELVSGSSADTSTCTTSDMQASVGRDSSGRTHRVIAKFGSLAGSLPQDSTVLDSDVAFYFRSQSSATDSDLDLHELQPVSESSAAAFTSSATWNRYDGTNAWTAAGGDVRAERETRRTLQSAWVDDDVSPKPEPPQRRLFDALKCLHHPQLAPRPPFPHPSPPAQSRRYWRIEARWP